MDFIHITFSIIPQFSNLTFPSKIEINFSFSLAFFHWDDDFVGIIWESEWESDEIHYLWMIRGVDDAIPLNREWEFDEIQCSWMIPGYDDDIVGIPSNRE